MDDMHTRKLALIGLALVMGGCELAGPLLIGEATKGDDDLGSEAAALSVEIESVSGTVAGRTFAPEMFTATGDRFGSQVSFQLVTQDGDLEVLVQSEAESSSTNPYTGEGSGFGDEGGSGEATAIVPVGGEGGLPLEPFASVAICDRGDCRHANDFGVALVQTDDGRNATVDGVWDAGESLSITLHYAEVD